VVQEPRLSTRAGTVDYCSFLVDDGSGTLRVQAHRGAARRLADENALPRKGTFVDVAGSLHVSAGEDPRLRLQAVEHLRILGARAEK
jgi:hypothetical protein